VEIEVARRPVAMFRELEAHDTLLAILAILLLEEQDEVRVGFKRARFAKV